MLVWQNLPMSKKLFKSLAPIIGAVVGSAILPGVGSALGASIGTGGGAAIGSGLASAGLNYSQTHNIGNALKAGALAGGGTYLGSMAGNALVGDKLGTIGSTVDKAIGGTGGLSNLVQNSIPAALANTTVGSALGGYMGNSIGQEYADSMYGKADNASASNSGATPFKPTRAGEQALPLSLSSLGGLNQDQQMSNIATSGVYGKGQGPEENSYFLNLVNRKLVDPSGGVAGTEGLSPITTSYLKQLGLGGFNNSTDLLQAISGWKA